MKESVNKGLKRPTPIPKLRFPVRVAIYIYGLPSSKPCPYLRVPPLLHTPLPLLGLPPLPVGKVGRVISVYSVHSVIHSLLPPAPQFPR